MDHWPPRIFCDTSFFFACLESRDVHHSEAIEWLDRSQRAPSAFWSTWDILSETVTLLRRKSGYRRAVEFTEEVIPSLHLVLYDDSVRLETLSVFKRFAKDKKLSYCDCLSYVVLTSLLENVPAATFDIHFKQMGLPVLGS